MRHSVEYAVDDLAPSNPNQADIQNSMKAVDPPSVIDTIVGTVDSGSVSVDPNLNTNANAYATLFATTHAFAKDLPAPNLPEGQRGESLKITGNDNEAAGQIRMILGSYIENLTVTDPTSFTLTFGSVTITESTGVGYQQLQSDIRGMSTIGAGNAFVTSTGLNTYQIALGSDLYLNNHNQFSATGASLAIDDQSLKLNSPRSVEPAVASRSH